VKASTIWKAYQDAEEMHESYPAMTQERQMDTFAEALTRKIEALERERDEARAESQWLRGILLEANDYLASVTVAREYFPGGYELIDMIREALEPKQEAGQS
jgi:hypothetical protein